MNPIPLYFYFLARCYFFECLVLISHFYFKVNCNLIQIFIQCHIDKDQGHTSQLCVYEPERERERERKRGRERERQRERETERVRDRERERGTQRQSKSDREREI